MDKMEEKFIYSELVPLESPFNLEISNLVNVKESKIRVKKPKISPITWVIYESKKMKTITMPHPQNNQDIFKKWKEIEERIFKKYKKDTKSISQFANGKYVNQKRKDINHSMFNNRYFTYKNNNTYSEMVEKAYEHSKRKESFISILDIKSYFPSIYIHSLQWSFFKGKHWEKKRDSLKENKIDSLDKKFHDVALLLSSSETNGLPIGPNLSRIISHQIGNQIDLIITGVLKGEKNTHLKIFRHIDDLYISHKNKIKDETIDIINSKLSRLNLKLNSIKTILNTKEDKKIDWEKEFHEMKPKAITGLFNNLNKYSSNQIDVYNDEEFYEKFCQRTSELILNINKDTNKLKEFKAMQINFIYKSYLNIKKRRNPLDLKVLKTIEKFAYDIWKKILLIRVNPAILNTFSPLINIISYINNKKYTKLKDRILKKNIEEYVELLFPYICSLYYIDRASTIKYLKSGYNLEFPIKKPKKASEEKIIKRINSSFIYK
ncbi:MAG: RNA-directed DNA polymerase [Mollicutes bacterium PWAP]|nr:RNA-directed DNA polymerase [Mollicutes bacterium PWAP]